ncbi:uncharacterized protein LOC127259269 [Andrographis paniculata]|uniref:uncharacterized protein LOC127259269 n=1 Tax=Andrographis paniculata TaxID=175694 RepID=UPI0021E70B8F|nr:uncharacterized protein LOC127259269 [Andrographis paniculata]
MKANRVVYAEAGKDFVDFLFYWFSFPLATVVGLLSKENIWSGSLTILYKSIENLTESSFQPNRIKDILLKPWVPQPYFPAAPLLPDGFEPPERTFYTCASSCLSLCRQEVADYRGALCSICGRAMMGTLKYVEPPEVARGFVSELDTYTVTDKLVVERQSSTNSGAAVLGELQVEERVVQLGYPEAIKVLKAALGSRMVLTNAFLRESF